MPANIAYGRRTVTLIYFRCLITFLLLGTVLAALQIRLSASARAPAAIATLLALLFVHASLEFAGPIHVAAALLWGSGLGIALARILVHRQEALLRLIRATTIPLALGVLAVSAAPITLLWVKEHRSFDRLAQDTKQAPNVILIILDTVRAMSMGLYDPDGANTPNLKQLARGGTVFSHAISTAPWTLPSHASMFTGRYVFELSVDWGKPLADPDSTLAEVLAARGYITAGFAANLLYVTRQLGLARGFMHFEDYPLTVGEAVLSTSVGRVVTDSRAFRRVTGMRDVLNRKPASQIVNDFIRWADARSQSQRARPVFAFLNLFDAHEPYLPPDVYRNAYKPTGGEPEYWYDANKAERYRLTGLNPEEIAPQLAAYKAAIAYMDAELGLLFDGLAHRGLLDNTIVIVTSDHGEEFGEHGVMSHVRSVHLPVLQVPLIVWSPGLVPSGSVVDKPVTLRDLPATVLTLLGMAAGSPIPGDSWTYTWSAGDKPAVPAAYLTQTTSADSAGTLLCGDYHYVRLMRETGVREELYNAMRDPLEQMDLSGDSAYSGVLQDLRKRLDAIRSSEDGGESIEAPHGEGNPDGHLPLSPMSTCRSPLLDNAGLAKTGAR